MSTLRSEARHISVAEAARIIGVTRGYVRMLADMGKLRATRGTFGIRLFDRAAVKRFARERTRQRAQRNFRQPFRLRPRGQEETAPLTAPATSSVP